MTAARGAKWCNRVPRSNRRRRAWSVCRCLAVSRSLPTLRFRASARRRVRVLRRWHVLRTCACVCVCVCAFVCVRVCARTCARVRVCIYAGVCLRLASYRLHARSHNQTWPSHHPDTTLYAPRSPYARRRYGNLKQNDAARKRAHALLRQELVEGLRALPAGGAAPPPPAPKTPRFRKGRRQQEGRGMLLGK